jgi:hypothetical protein
MSGPLHIVAAVQKLLERPGTTLFRQERHARENSWKNRMLAKLACAVHKLSLPETWPLRACPIKSVASGFRIFTIDNVITGKQTT